MKHVQPGRAYQWSTCMRHKIVKQEFLGSSATLPVGQVKCEVVKKAKAKAKQGYALPEQYAHLQPLPTFLKGDLDSQSSISDE